MMNWPLTLNCNCQFGIMACTESSDGYCRELAPDGPAVLVLRASRHHEYGGDIEEAALWEFVQLVLDDDGT